MDDQDGNRLTELIRDDLHFKSLGEYQKTIEYQENCLKIATEIGDREGEGTPYGNLGDAY